MAIFYGGAIQGAKRERAAIHKQFIDTIKECGCELVTEHTAATTLEESWAYLEKAFGTMPPPGKERSAFIRKKLMAAVEEADAAIFDLTVPSIGTGMELTHALLRSRLGKLEIPILFLFEKGAELSNMIRGSDYATVQLAEFSSLDKAKQIIKDFLKQL